jgi:hypothetical protein
VTEPDPKASAGRGAASSPKSASSNGGSNGHDSNGKGSFKLPEPTVRVRSLRRLAAKYNLSEPDAFVGAESSQYVLDYGKPKVLADSARQPSAQPGLLERLLDRL